MRGQRLYQDGFSMKALYGLMVCLAACLSSLGYGEASVEYRVRKRDLPADPWKLFNISVKAEQNKTEGKFE